MTPDDLAAIRERDAADDLYRLTSGNLSTEGEKVTALMGALMDRRALLAEVDRLTEYTPWITDKWVEGYDAAVARLRAGVEGLRSHEPADDNEGDYVLRAAVLALFDGGEA